MPAITNLLRIIVEDSSLALKPEIACVKAAAEPLIVSVDWSQNTLWESITLTNFQDVEDPTLFIGPDSAALVIHAGDPAAHKLEFAVPNCTAGYRFYSFDVILQTTGARFTIDPVIIIKPWV